MLSVAMNWLCRMTLRLSITEYCQHAMMIYSYSCVTDYCALRFALLLRLPLVICHSVSAVSEFPPCPLSIDLTRGALLLKKKNA